MEVSAAIFRKASAGEMNAGEAALAVEELRSDVEHVYQTVEVGEVVAERAMEVAEKHRLRGYDCIQLACVLLLNEHRVGAGLENSILVSADGELNEAAKDEGITVEEPTG
ncbi:MAG: type II toxin-antitoxin system VapC family toxin [Rubrobacter sp.]|nr:type II toxin-antitoxin system VapC family toxin [Rubrobacter sp.]